VESHVADLREEVGEEIARAVRDDWRTAPVDEPTRALLAYAEKMTKMPQAMTEEDMNVLRNHGHSDEAIHDAAQVTAYFNYINRIADALGVDPEEFMSPAP
jgi:uncharacterized peroxidase-related enzyme